MHLPSAPAPTPDEAVTQAPRLTQSAIRPLEELCIKRGVKHGTPQGQAKGQGQGQGQGRGQSQGEGKGQGKGQSALLLHAVPNLLRIVNSMSAAINGVWGWGVISVGVASYQWGGELFFVQGWDINSVGMAYPHNGVGL